MSDVKMCDHCSKVFSVLVEDWSTFEGTRRRRDPISRRLHQETVQQDYCPECTGNTFSGSKALNGATIPEDETS
jgi:hypothetical protein